MSLREEAAQHRTTALRAWHLAQQMHQRDAKEKLLIQAAELEEVAKALEAEADEKPPHTWRYEAACSVAPDCPVQAPP